MTVQSKHIIHAHINSTTKTTQWDMQDFNFLVECVSETFVYMYVCASNNSTKSRISHNFERITYTDNGTVLLVRSCVDHYSEIIFL